MGKFRRETEGRLFQGKKHPMFNIGGVFWPSFEFMTRFWTVDTRRPGSSAAATECWVNQ